MNDAPNSLGIATRRHAAPLIVVGALLALSGAAVLASGATRAGSWMVTVGAVYGFVGVLARRGGIHRKVVMCLWFPLLFVTLRGGIRALTELRDGIKRPAPAATSPNMGSFRQDILDSVHRELGIREKDATKDFERELKIAPGRLNDFLEELFLYQGLPVSSDDRRQVRTLEQLIALVESRLAELPATTTPAQPEATSHGQSG